MRIGAASARDMEPEKHSLGRGDRVERAMSSRDRERILNSLELALGFPHRCPSIVTPEGVRARPEWEDPRGTWDRIRQELEAVSARFSEAKDLNEAQDAIRGLLRGHAIRTAVRWEHPVLRALQVDELLEEAGVEILRPEADRRYSEAAARADLGITAGSALLTESGTLVVAACAGQERSASLLPPVHLAVVPGGRRIASVMDLPPFLRGLKDEGGRLPSAVHLITGPSRTADIEITMVLGVHGPKVLHILALGFS